MTFIVKSVKTPEQKSIQEQEAELLRQHNEEQLRLQEQDKEKVIVNDPPELKEDDVLSFIGKKYGRQLKTIDELFAAPVVEELPSDVAAFAKFKKETGRGINDYVQLNSDVESINPDSLLRNYLLETEEGLDSSDVDVLMKKYSFDEDVDDESKVERVKLEKKKDIAKAKKYFNEQKEKFKAPLESRENAIPAAELEEFKSYKQYMQDAKIQQQESELKRNWFLQETDKVFSPEFKGFEFSLDEKKIVYTPGDAAELKKNQLSPMNFISKYLDDKGLLKDAAGYHRALAIAMNPERFAKFFYEQGQAEATEDIMKKTKNINMSTNRSVEATAKGGGFQAKAVNPDSGPGLKVRFK